ncbi:MAG: hypothetical protein ACRD8O_13095 [Bryobacteraceae bacterium]
MIHRSLYQLYRALAGTSVVLAISSAALAQSRPFIPGEIIITHAASILPANSPASGLAPGSLFGINLRGLSFTDEVQAGEKITLRFRMGSSNSSEELPLFFTDTDAYFESIVPATAEPGPAEIIVVAGRKIFPLRIYIASFNFGFFSKSGVGFGSAVAQNNGASGAEANQLTTPVRPGTYLTLWGTGLGRNSSGIVVELGGVSLSPTYAGPAPGFPGVDQINVRIPPEPSGIPDGCYVPIRIRMGSQISPAATITKSGDPGPCAHPLGLSLEKLETLDRGDSLPVGQVDLISFIEPDYETREPNSSGARESPYICIHLAQPASNRLPEPWNRLRWSPHAAPASGPNLFGTLYC